MFKNLLLIAAIGLAASIGPARAETGPDGGSGVSFTFSNLESKPGVGGGYLQSSRETAREKPRSDNREDSDADPEEHFTEMKTIQRGGKSRGAKFIEIKNDGTVIERHY